MKKIICLVIIFSMLLTATLGLCACDDEKLEYIQENTTYTFDSISLITFNSATLMPVIDIKNSGITLDTAGNVRIRVMLAPYVSTIANNVIKADMLTGVDINSIVDTYCVELFPGFTLSDVQYSLSMLKKSLGIGFVGLNFNDPSIKAFVDDLKDGQLSSVPTIPAGLGVEYTGKYHIKMVTSSITGEVYKAVYVDKHGDKGEPYVIMTLSEDNNVKKCDMDIEFLPLRIKSSVKA